MLVALVIMITNDQDDDHHHHNYDNNIVAIRMLTMAMVMMVVMMFTEILIPRYHGYHTFICPITALHTHTHHTHQSWRSSVSNQSLLSSVVNTDNNNFRFILTF